MGDDELSADKDQDEDDDDDNGDRDENDDAGDGNNDDAADDDVDEYGLQLMPGRPRIQKSSLASGSPRGSFRFFGRACRDLDWCVRGPEERINTTVVAALTRVGGGSGTS